MILPTPQWVWCPCATKQISHPVKAGCRFMYDLCRYCSVFPSKSNALDKLIINSVSSSQHNLHLFSINDFYFGFVIVCNNANTNANIVISICLLYQKLKVCTVV